jgi:hypothetical protein
MRGGTNCPYSSGAFVFCKPDLALLTRNRHPVRHQGDFDVSDRKIENAAGGRLMVSTKEMQDTLKFPSQQEVTLLVAL